MCKMQTIRHKRKRKRKMLDLCDEDLKEKNIATGSQSKSSWKIVLIFILQFIVTKIAGKVMTSMKN